MAPGKRVVITDEDRVFIRRRAAEGILFRQIAEELSERKPYRVTWRMLQYRAMPDLRAGYEEARLKGIKVNLQIGRPSPNGEMQLLDDIGRKQIQDLAGYGMKNDQIAQIMNLGKMTLIAHYQDDLDIGRARAHSNVAKTLYEMAVSKDFPNMTKFYLCCQAGWKETTAVEFPDKDGNPQKISGDITNINLTAERMQTMIALLDEKV